MKLLVLINKEEKNEILKRYPYVCVVRTVKSKSKRHRYYCEEHKGAMALLNRIRNGAPVSFDYDRRYNTKQYKGARR